MKSLQELMYEAFCLSMDCAYSEITHDGYYSKIRNDLPPDMEDMIFRYADGLMDKYLNKIMKTNKDWVIAIDKARPPLLIVLWFLKYPVHFESSSIKVAQNGSSATGETP